MQNKQSHSKARTEIHTTYPAYAAVRKNVNANECVRECVREYVRISIEGIVKDEGKGVGACLI